MGKMPISPGDTLDGRYELGSELSRSDRSMVFEATHPMTGRVVAVKALRPGRARDPDKHRHFLAQVRMLADSQHRHVVRLLDAGSVDLTLDEKVNVPYYVMEMLGGRTLEEALEGRGTVAAPDAVVLGVSLCRALGCMHRAGVVHGGVSPAHIMLPPKLEEEPPWDAATPVVKLIDFSLAAGTVDGVHLTPSLCQEGMEYQSPEQLSEKALTAASDIFSLGVVLYECLTGDPPVGRIIVPPHRLNKAVPEPVSLAVEAAVQRDVKERPQSAQAFAEALAKAPHKPPPKPTQPTQPTQPRAEQRRRPDQAAYVAPVEIRRDVGLPVQARCEDISLGGLMVVSGAKLGDKERVVVQFALPITGDEVLSPAEVRWRKMSRNKLYVGLQLEKLSAKANEAIEQHVKRVQAGQ